MKVILVSFLLLNVALATLTCECGKRNAGRIYGGQNTKKNEYPWMVALQRRDNDFTDCGGTIVTPWHVVTAAHCVSDQQANEMLLLVGAYDVHDFKERTSQYLLVDKIIIHPYYDTSTNVADLALLVTSDEIVFTKFVGPACMPSGGMGDEMVGQIVKAMGWGRYDPTKSNNDKVKKLKEVDLEITSVSSCKGGDGKQICTYAPHKSTCMGDSGGPVVWLDPEANRFILVGVVSNGPTNCGNSTLPSVNTNVSFYKDWIELTIADTKKDVNTCHKV